jgi:hypothetical protein
MHADSTLRELWRVKDELGRKHAQDPRAICGDLMEQQRQLRPSLPLVHDLSASLAQHAARIAKLPPPPPTESFLADDPIVAEVRRIRERRTREHPESPLALKENPRLQKG